MHIVDEVGKIARGNRVIADESRHDVSGQCD
jgi:hypothetical protein